MKKLILLVALSVFISTSAMAATIYTTTINETTIPHVQDVVLEIMMGKNFYIDDVDSNKVIVGKNFGDGIWVPTTFCKVKESLIKSP